MSCTDYRQDFFFFLYIYTTYYYYYYYVPRTQQVNYKNPK